jgi:cell division septation protein DedD
MERQIKHRILGIFVIIGLVILLLPLFHTSHKELAADSTLKTPPFPDQAIQVTESALETVPENPPITTDPKSKDKDLFNALRPSIVSNTIYSKLPTKKVSAEISKEDPLKTTHLKPLASIIKNEMANDESLTKLNSSVWVIQLGSFKNKTNALRLVNKLRANGYKAFIQQVSAVSGGTRVFVGPEHKKTLAHALASRLQNEMHIKGVVVSYKPLTL